MDKRYLIKSELQQAAEILEVFRKDEAMIDRIEQAAMIIANTLANDHKVISCGNGGSLCDAMHFAEELTGRYQNDRRPLPALAISDSSHLSCVSNDFGFNHVFSRYVEALGGKGDVLMCFSTSGNSVNVVEAAKAARAKHMRVISLTGNSGGQLAGLSDVAIAVQHNGYADRIQEIHIKIVHILILLIEHTLDLKKPD